MHEHVYGWLLRLYPGRFRQEYGDEALQLFRDRLQDERGVLRRIRFWLDIAGDLLVSVCREHRRPAPPGPLPASIARNAAGTPYLHLITDGLPVHHLLIGAVCALVVFSAVTFTLLREVRASGPMNIGQTSASSAGIASGLAARRLLAASQDTGTGIEGIVHALSDGAPVAGAWIAVTRLGADGARPAGTPATPPIPDAWTDAAGRFQIRSLEPGTYRLIVMASGYVRHERQTITLATGQIARDVAVGLTPASAISGRIQDAAGRPLAGVVVTLHRRAYSASGEPSLRLVANGRTNDLGEYRFYWITPGRYFVSAQAGGASVLAADPLSAFERGVYRGINEVTESYPQVFFPGFPQEDRAAPVDVVPGYEIRGIDLVLTRTGGYRVRGRVIDAATGNPPAEMSISGFDGTRYFRNAESGEFEFINIPPGTYNLTATAGLNVGISALLNPDSSQPRGVATVTVTDADVDNVVLTISPTRVIHGSIQVEGTLQAPSQVGPVRFNLVPQSRPLTGGSGVIAVSTRADGTFEFGSLNDGMFRVSMPNLPAGLYLKEALLDGVDMLNGFASIGSAQKLELRISAPGGAVDGVVQDAAGRPVFGAQTVLIPAERHRTDLYKRVLSDLKGRFSFSGIAPGRYKLFAWAGLDDYAYFDPAVLERFEAQGHPLEVGESSKQSVPLPLFSGEQP